MASGFQCLQLIVQGIADASLQQAGDVLVELAVLAPQGGDRDDHGRLDVPQAKNHLF